MNAREEAIEVMTADFIAWWEETYADASPALKSLRDSAARPTAERMLDAALKAGVVVLRDDLEQVTTADGLAHWAHDGGGVEWNGQPVFVLRGED